MLWTSNEADSAKYAVSAEALAFRFAATASAGINSWEPGKGNVEVGVKASAAISLAEGSIALKSYFPDQGGYVVRMPYRNAEGKEVVSDIGIFRLAWNPGQSWRKERTLLAAKRSNQFDSLA